MIAQNPVRLNNLYTWPLLGPLLALLRNMEFVTMIIVAVADAVVALHPAFVEMRGQLIVILTLIGTALVSGQIYEKIKAGVALLRSGRYPFFSPLMGLLRSRKFSAALIGLIVNVVVAYMPAFEPVQAELNVVFTVVFSTIIAMIAYDDGREKEAAKSA
jgi:hypothetical protein